MLVVAIIVAGISLAGLTIQSFRLFDQLMEFQSCKQENQGLFHRIMELQGERDDARARLKALVSRMDDLSGEYD
jgi:FtsZ-binding cell division protein ZapB